MPPVRVLIEIDDTEYSVVHQIETEDPIVKTLQKIAKSEQIPLRTKTGRPYPWTVEGPDVRPGREGGWTDLTRTQTTERIHEWYTEEERADSADHLFRLKFFIPGAVEAINEKQQAEKIAEIERRMAQRAAERDEAAAAEREAKVAEMGSAEDFTMEPPPPPPPPVAAPPPPPPPAPPPRRPEPPDEPDEIVTQRVEKRPPKRKKRRPPPPPKKKGVPKWVYGAGAAVLVGGVLVAMLSGDPEPEPTPEPTPAPTPPPVKALVIKKEATPEPTPLPEATPKPVKLETFFSKAKITKYTAKQDAARLTSFAQTDVLLGYKANHTAPGETHTIELEGRFRVEISDGSAGIFAGGSVSSVPGTVAVGAPTSVSLRFDGKKLTVNVGGKRKTTTVAGTTGFPRWRITVPGDATLTGFYAKGRPEE